MPYFQTHKNEFKFFILTGCVIIYSQLYPLRFHSYTADAGLIKHYLKTLSFSETGDCLSNILLFFAFGFLGIRSMASKGRKTSCILTLLTTGMILGFLLQFSHFFIYTRNFSLGDTMLSGIATLAGAGLGSLDYLRFFGGRREDELKLTVPAFISVLWPLSLLVPFIPHAHLADIKHSIMILNVQISVKEALTFTISWLLFAHLVSAARRKNISCGIFACMVILTSALQLITEGQALSTGSASGGILALPLWGIITGMSGNRTVPLTAAAILVICLGALPFKPLMHPGSFDPVPFHGFLSDPDLKAIIAILKKAFIYGSLLWLLKEAGVGPVSSTVFCLMLTIAIEYIQLYLPGRDSEATDPVMVLLIALWMKKHEKQNKPTDHSYNKKERRK